MKKKKTQYSKLAMLAIQIAIPLVLVVLLMVVGWRIIMSPASTKPTETTQPTEPPVIQTEPAQTETFPTEPDSLLPPNRYGKNDFQYYGDYLKCLAGESIMGIDVSRYQGNIDWAQVRDVGVEFAIIRVGGRSYGDDGEIYEDINAEKNYQGATAAGLKVGVYFFAQAINVAEAREEAAYVLDRIKDWNLEMPVVYDWEYVSSKARTADVDTATLTECTKAFCEIVEDAGYDAMVYFNPTHQESRVDLEQLMDYKFWLAMYSDRMTYPYYIDMWQYTDQGVIPGIEGPVDINLYFPPEED